ncbi:aminopeptidase P family protein [Primorskyibacter sp. S187A]|uniref:aminopeptidase P family protein n=1 Tax=Primorskyibacter sp. S187A TaxID=3415130 RepID=UPI003C7C8817
MFQSFEVTARPEQGPPRLQALRAAMAQSGLDAFIVPRADAHQGEYVAPHDERLAWLTGFTGSAGFAVVTQSRAAVFVDGRYRVQVRAQVADVFEPVDWPETSLDAWLKDAMPKGVVGYDPWLHTPREIRQLVAAGIELKAVRNPVDAIWDDQPAPPVGRVISQPDALAGRSSAEKRGGLAEELRAAGCTACVITLPDSLSWLLNIRGEDIPRNPVVHGMTILHDTGDVDLFIDAAKLADVDLGAGVTLHAPDAFIPACAALTGLVMADPDTAPQAVFDVLSDVHEARDPCLLPKACKTEAEISGARTAHLRDAVAMVHFLHWLETHAPGDLTEIDVATKLEGFRRETNQLRDISFETISGAGPHAALPHYRVTKDSNRALKEGEVYLVDSGGQYQDGTTDITRTIGIGPQADHVRRAFTRVLQGMIGISRLRFPPGISGADIDSVARVALWAAGQDYAHGTGHGVGAYLSVHEGPQRLARTGREPLQKGMILSNEPGFYAEGEFGIRIENLIVVEPAPRQPDQSLPELLQFETLTFVPIDRHMIEREMLTAPEREWMNSYHADCLEKLSPHVTGDVAEWLRAACAPL